MARNDGRIVSAGVDWFSASADVLKKGEDWYDRALRLLLQEQELGNKLRHYRLHKYPMSAAGEVAIGQSDEATLVQLSGAVARHYWADFAAEADHVSRIDVQTTVVISESEGDIGEKAAMVASVAKTRSGQTPKVYRYGQVGHSTTCYIGSPASEVRLRLYNKAEESRGEWPTNSWRYEVQLRDEHARNGCTKLLGLGPTSYECPSFVHYYFSRLQVRPLFDAKDFDWHDLTPPVTTDKERKLAWLTTQVRPSVEWLQHYVEVTELRNILGLGGPPRSMIAARHELRQEQGQENSGR